MTYFTSASASTREVVTTLNVTQGLHHGASIALTEPVCRIGSDENADVLLGDPDIAPEHVVLRFHGRQSAIEALGGDITIDGRRVNQGAGLRCELPVELCFNNVTLELSRPAVPSAFSRLPTLPAYWRGPLSRAVTLSALIATLGVLAFYQLIDVNQADAHIKDYPVSLVVSEPTTSGQLLAADKTQQPVEALRQHLEEAELSSLEVNDHGDYLSVTGHYAPDQVNAWQGTQRWFDEHYGSQKVLLNEARPSEAATRPELQLQAVWLGQNPYVIDTQGERLYPGASLASGWVISAIEAEQILLSRGDDEFALTL